MTQYLPVLGGTLKWLEFFADPDSSRVYALYSPKNGPNAGTFCCFKVSKE